MWTLMLLLHFGESSIASYYMPNLSYERCVSLMHTLNTTANGLSICVEQKEKL